MRFFCSKRPEGPTLAGVVSEIMSTIPRKLVIQFNYTAGCN